MPDNPLLNLTFTKLQNVNLTPPSRERIASFHRYFYFEIVCLTKRAKFSVTFPKEGIIASAGTQSFGPSVDTHRPWDSGVTAEPMVCLHYV
jgi:hypothetical protein